MILPKKKKKIKKARKRTRQLSHVKGPWDTEEIFPLFEEMRRTFLCRYYFCRNKSCMSSLKLHHLYLSLL